MSEKKNIPLADKLKRAKQVIDAINTQTGAPPDKPVAFFASEPVAKIRYTTRYIPTPCTELNEQISGEPGTGGLPIGSWTIVSGTYDSGD